MPLFKRRENRSWELNWHERTEKQRKGEVRLWSKGTMVGLFCVVAAFVVFGALYAAGPNLPAPAKPGAKTTPAASTQQTQQAAPEQQAAPAAPNDPRTQKIDELLASMTTEQKVAQLFITSPENLTGVGLATAAGQMTHDAISERPVGGIIYAQGNLQEEEQTMTMLETTQRYSKEAVGLPMFLAVVEEGGENSTVGGNEGFGIARVSSASNMSSTDEARSNYKNIGDYLLKLGFNLDLAPVADIANNPNSTTMKKRSFGSDPAVVTDMVRAATQGLDDSGILSCAKHFPGIGGAEGDSASGAITSHRTADEMKTTELLPFEAAISEGTPFIMVGHLSVSQITGNTAPASLSSQVVTDLLRNELGYQGIIITDELGLAAVTDAYTSSEAAVLAIQAGNDMILKPKDFDAAYNAVLDAVNSGRISEDRLNESLRRILGAKIDMQADLSAAGYKTASGNVS